MEKVPRSVSEAYWVKIECYFEGRESSGNGHCRSLTSVAGNCANARWRQGKGIGSGRRQLPKDRYRFGPKRVPRLGLGLQL